MNTAILSYGKPEFYQLSLNLKSDFQFALAKYLKAYHVLQDRLFGREKSTSQRLVDSP